MRRSRKARLEKLFAEIRELEILRLKDFATTKLAHEERGRFRTFLDFLDDWSVLGGSQEEANARGVATCPDFWELARKAYWPSFPGDTVEKYRVRMNLLEEVTRVFERSYDNVSTSSSTLVHTNPHQPTDVVAPAQTAHPSANPPLVRRRLRLSE